MKEYIKKFESAASANNYEITDIPFTSTVSGATPQNVRCNQENKKIEVDGQGNISVVDAGPVLPPNDEIWYTSSDGNIVTPYQTSSLPTIVSNTYVDGKGVMKFATDVTSIGNYAFQIRSGLTSVVIPNSVTSIGSGAFSNCTSLASVTIGNSVTSIGSFAFSGCDNLPVVDNLRYADTYLVEAVDKTLSSYTIKDGTKWIGDNVFNGCTGLTSVTIPNSVTSIGIQAFYNCKGLTSVVIPDSVTSIKDYVFQNCTSLTSVTIPSRVTSIGTSAFEDCTSLSSVTIPNSVTNIGIEAFYGCKSLATIMIPNSVTSIGNGAFSYCTSLTSVTIGNNVTTIKPSAFQCGSGSYEGSLEIIFVGENVFTYDGVSQHFAITLGNDSVIGLMMYYSGGGSND